MHALLRRLHYTECSGNFLKDILHVSSVSTIVSRDALLFSSNFEMFFRAETYNFSGCLFYHFLDLQFLRKYSENTKYHLTAHKTESPIIAWIKANNK